MHPLHVNLPSLALVLQGDSISVRNFQIKSKAIVFLDRQSIKAPANLYFCGLCCEVIKHNQYDVLHTLKLNIEEEVNIDAAQRLEQLL